MEVVEVYRSGNRSVIALPRDLEERGFEPGTRAVVEPLPNGDQLLRCADGLVDPARTTPLRREDALPIIAEDRDEIRRRGVRELHVFGSVARDEARCDSDVDILVEVESPFGLFDLVELQEYLEQALGRPVDLFTPGALRPEARATALKDAIRAA